MVARRTSCFVCEHLPCFRLGLVLAWAEFSTSGCSSSAAPWSNMVCECCWLAAVLFLLMEEVSCLLKLALEYVTGHSTQGAPASPDTFRVKYVRSEFQRARKIFREGG